MNKINKEQGKGNCFSVCLLLIASCLLMVIGCQNPFSIQHAPGKGVFVLHIGDDSGRTIMPTEDGFAAYTLQFTGSGNPETMYRTRNDIDLPISLPPGTYTLSVSAYADAQRTKLVATGTLSGIVISMGNITNKNIVLYGIVEAGANGTYKWKIGFPQGANAFMSITPLDDNNTDDIQTIPLDEQVEAEGVAYNEGEMALPAGYYRVTFSLDDGERDFSREDYLHIYKDMESYFEYTFSMRHFDPILPHLTGTVSITGTAGTGRTLTAVTTALNGEGTLSYVWKRRNLIVGTDSSYTVQPADVGNAIALAVMRQGYSGTASAVTGTILFDTIMGSGTTQAPYQLLDNVWHNGTLSAATAEIWYSFPVTQETAYHIWWNSSQNGPDDNNKTAVVLVSARYAGSSTWIFNSIQSGWAAPQAITAAQTGTLEVKVVPLDASSTGTYGIVYSTGSTRPLIGSVPTGLSGTVSISGTAEVGATLTAQTDLNGSGVISYQWGRNGIPIGTNSSTYQITSDDTGGIITVTVSRSGTVGSLTSASFAVVNGGLTGIVITRGIPRVGGMLTADTSALGGNGAIQYQWRRGPVAIVGMNSDVYVLRESDAGSLITVTVQCAGIPGSVTSVPRLVSAASHYCSYIWTATTPATCIMEGEETEVCSQEPTHTRDVRPIKDFGHNTQWNVTTPAVCGIAGEEKEICMRCYVVITTHAIPALEHSYDWVITTPAVCLSGSQKQVCSYCGIENGITEPILAPGHNFVYVPIIPSTCLVAGTQQAVCSRCGITSGNPYPLQLLPHNYVDTFLIPSTCSDTGLQIKTCSYCGAQTGDSFPLPVLPHSYVEVGMTPATCVATGLLKQVCERCGYEGATQGIPALGHSYSDVTVTPATCVTAGSYKQVCSRCFNEGAPQVISPLGHDFELTLAIPATCDTAGSRVNICSRCSLNGTTEVIPVLGHDYEWTTITPTTENRPGMEIEICSRCNGNRDERSAATLFTLNTAVSATLPAGDFRWYRFTLPQDTDIALSVTRTSGNGYLFAYLYNGDFLTHLLSTSDYGNISDHALLSDDGKAMLPPGTYYVRFDNSAASSASGTIKVAPITRVVSGVTVSPSTAQVVKGSTHNFSAKVAGTNNPAQTVSWSIVQANKHAQTRIDRNGILTVSNAETLTALTVRATSTVDGSKYGEASVTLLSNISGVTVSPSAAQVAKGNTYTFSAVVAGTNYPAQTVSWSIVQAGKHAQTSINADGVLTVNAAEPLGSLTVRATSTVDGSKYGEASVTILTPTVNSVTVDPATARVITGDTHSFSAEVTGTNSPALTVTWSIVESEKHAQTNINASGVLSVSAAETLTTLTVRATSTYDGSKYGEAAVAVVSVSGVTVDPSAAQVAKGNTHTFSATVNGANSPAQTVSWSIVEAGKHAQTTIDADGVLTVNAAESLDSLTVRATSTVNNTKHGEVTVTILTPTVSSVTVNPSTALVIKGDNYNFSATVAGTNSPAQTVSWSIVQTNKHAQTSINADGVLSVSNAETLTTLTVRATSTYDNSKYGDATVTVASNVSGVTVNPSTAQVAKGDTYTFSATVNGTNNPAQTVSWSIVQTNKHAQTTINSNGVLTVNAAETLTTLTVRATSTADSSKYGNATATIISSTVSGITVYMPTPYVVKGGNYTFRATETGGNSPVQAVTWTIVDTGRHRLTYLSSTDEEGAIVLNVSSSEALTTLTVRATSTVDNSKYGEATVTVFNPGYDPDDYYVLPLVENTWYDGEVNNYDFRGHTFPVTEGTTYYVWWNDRYQGSVIKTGDVIVGARYEGGTIIFGGSGTTWATNYDVDSGYNTPQTFTATQTGTVQIRVRGYTKGTYGIVFSTESTRPE